jgi:hypothetical protein
MVYASPIDLSNDDPQDLVFTAMADPPSRPKPVRVYFNDKAVDEIAGPVPLVDLNTTYNVTQGGNTQSKTTKITLTGKILRTTFVEPNLDPSGVGTKNLLVAITGLEGLFKATNGVFKIQCGSDIVYRASGVKVNSFSANKSSDNWLFTSDYTVDLEFTESINKSYFIKSGSDSWTVEPMEEYVYTNINPSVSAKEEYSNPLLNPPATQNSSNATPTTVRATNIDVLTIPQFKISRKVSAEGIPSGTGENYSSYINARNWVQNQLAIPFGNGNNTTNARFSSGGISAIAGFEKVFLYNHLRSTNFSPAEGSYEVNDTWLAMPTGIKYVEDYSIETSTDERFIKTVRVQGNIKGLQIDNISIMSGTTGLVPDSGGIIDLQYSMTSGTGGAGITQKIPDKLSSNSNDQNYYGAKYSNALSGWLNDIKPYLYRRASMMVNSPDRTLTYIDTTTTPQRPPNNPTYSKEPLLNTIPISTTESHDPRKGSISYTYEFNNRFRFLSGVLSEVITVNDTGPTEVINQAFVLGRRLGPVIQSLGTRTNANKSVTIEVIVAPPTGSAGFFISSQECPLWTGGTTYKTIEDLIKGFQPFGERLSNVFGNTMARASQPGQVFITQDDTSWAPTEGRYTRNIAWVYQTCNVSQFYKDH